MVYDINDSVDGLYFMKKGIAGLVFQYKIGERIVYTEIQKGDEFGCFVLL